MKTIYLDDLQIHDSLATLGFFVMPAISGLETPEIRLPSFVRPNVDGAVVPNQLYGGRLISFQGKVHATTVATHRLRRRQLIDASKINRDSLGVLRPLTLKFTTDDDIDLQVDVYTKSLVMPDKNMTNSTFKLDLFAPTLYLLGQQLKSFDIYIFQGGGWEVPSEVPLDMSVGGATTTNLENEGTVDSYPVYTLRGPLENPTFNNETNGQSFSLTYTLDSDGFIVIDTVNRTVVFYASEDDAPVNIRQYFSGDFVLLSPGANQVKFSNADFNNSGLISVVYRDSYSGI